MDGNGEEIHTNWTPQTTLRTLKLKYAKASALKVVGQKNDMALDIWDEHKNTRN